MQVVIDVPEEIYERFGYEYREENLISKHTNDIILDAFCNGIPLPKRHGRLIDENYLLSILQCKEYETCTWRNCSDCNREKCIKRRTILNAPTIIEADKESEDKE